MTRKQRLSLAAVVAIGLAAAIALCGAPGKAETPPKTYCANVAVTLVPCAPTPTPTPGPTPTPTPGPTPTPTPGQCPLAVADVESFVLTLKAHGGQQLDLTPSACGAAARAALPGCGASCCALSPDNGPVAAACANVLWGPPLWDVDGLTVPISDDGYTVKIAEGDGLLTAIPTVFDARAKPGAARQWHVFKGIPACDADANGVCR